MVLLLEGIIQSGCPENTESLYNYHPAYRETAKTLLAMPKRIVGFAGLLYVMQREFVVTKSDDKNVSIIGSDDATTCIIVIVRHSDTGVVALGHFDGSGTENAVFTIVDKVLHLAKCPGGRIEVQLIGGYTDAQHMSEDLFFDIVNAFHRHSVEVDLTLACVGQMNTEIREGIPWPRLYGVGVDVKTGETFPATFPEKGPEQSLRGARHLSGHSHFLDVYDADRGLLTISPFRYGPLRGTAFWLGQDDRVILDGWSTSPLVEPPHFVAQIRAILECMRDRPAEDVFRGWRPLCFGRDERDGKWVLHRASDV